MHMNASIMSEDSFCISDVEGNKNNEGNNYKIMRVIIVI